MFERNKANLNGCSMQSYLPRITRYQLIQAFDHAESGYVDEEKGYSGDEWTFTSPDCESPVYLYFRFDVCRIGARDEQAAQLFIAQMRLEHPELDWSTYLFLP